MTIKISRFIRCVCAAFFVFSISLHVQAKRPGLSGLTALADSPDTTFWNPAGMTRLPESLESQLVTVFRNSDFEVDEATHAGGDPKSQNDIYLIPGFYYVRPLSDQWTAGVSLNIPSGFGGDYGKTWSGRYLSREFSLDFVSLNPSVAYQFNDAWSFAAGMQAMYAESYSTASVNNLGPREDGRIKLDVDGTGAGYTLSALYEFSPSTRFGLNYRSKVDIELEGTPKFRNVNAAYLLALEKKGLLGKEAEVDFEVPAIAQFGVFHQINERYSMTADIVWLDMSEFGVSSVSAGADHLSVEPIFQDSWLTSTSVGYQWDSKTILSAGVGYMRSPSDKEDRTLYLPLDRVWIVGMGVEKELQSGDIINVSFEYVDLGSAPVDQQNTPLSGRVKGDYENNYAALVDFSYRFDL